MQILCSLLVFSGVMGCMTLLVKKGIEKIFFMVLLFGILAKSVFIFVVSDAISLFDMDVLMVPGQGF